MRARFIGDPNDDFSGPKVFPIYGVEFPKGVFMPLDGLDDGQVAKLANNNHFEFQAGAGKALNVDPPAETVVIPDDWEGLKWPQLRSLACKLTDDPVGNKETALDTIAAEVGRRASRAKKAAVAAPTAQEPAKPTAEAEFQAWAEGDD
jgi:hypothetical protein